MEIESIQKICGKYPGVTEDIKWENHLCFCVGEKMFLILGLDETPTTSSIKTSDEDFTSLSEQDGFKPAPYMARNKWVWMDSIDRLSQQDWETYIEKAYKIISQKLSKKKQLELGLIS